MTDKRGGIPAEQYAGFGLQLVIAVLLFGWLGSVLDRHLGTQPAFLIVGVFVGAAASIYSMYRKVMANTRGPER